MELALKMNKKLKWWVVVGVRAGWEDTLSRCQSTKNMGSSSKENGLMNREAREFQRLTISVLQHQWTQGHSYFCDEVEKYSPRHKCKKREINVLVLQDIDRERYKE